MAKYWDVDREREVQECEVREAWEAATASEEYDGTFARYLADCLSKNGSLISWEAHEAKERAQAEAEARAEAEFSGEAVKLTKDTKRLLRAGDVLSLARTHERYLVRTVLENKNGGFSVTVQHEDGRCLYLVPLSGFYGFDIEMP